MSQPAITPPRWTSADLELMPDNSKRYEIIDGELYVSKPPHWHHQATCGRIFAVLDAWSVASGLGEVSLAPGVIFADDDDVAPDIVWASTQRLALGLDDSGKLRTAPELAVEVLSPGLLNERRDREAKLKLYARRGVDEYWIVDWRLRALDVYRRNGATLDLFARLTDEDVLESPLLPGFSSPLSRVFPAKERL
ncbi:MAG: Uma2 family endonuclease [Chloroflexota bacterium]